MSAAERRERERPFHVLFLCTGNSARSLMAECALRRWGPARFRAFSAGSHPKPAPHPRTLDLLHELGYDTSTLRSKSWEEFAAPEGPPLDFVFTVCDDAAGETCPLWPAQPVTAHWGVADPAAAEGSEEQRRKAFLRAYLELESRIKIFTSLRLEALEGLALTERLDAIGRGEAPKAEG